MKKPFAAGISASITSGPHSTSSIPRGSRAFTIRRGLTGSLSSDGIRPTGPPSHLGPPQAQPADEPSDHGGQRRDPAALLERTPDVQPVQAERAGQLVGDEPGDRPPRHPADQLPGQPSVGQRVVPVPGARLVGRLGPSSAATMYSQSSIRSA